jgi:hypothetical protein
LKRAWFRRKWIIGASPITWEGHLTIFATTLSFFIFAILYYNISTAPYEQIFRWLAFLAIVAGHLVIYTHVED